MSAMIKLCGFTAPKKVFVWYDFKQVRDAVLVVVQDEQTMKFKKAFVYESLNGWETEILKNFMDADTYTALCKRLEYLFRLSKLPGDFEGLDIEEAVENYSNFLVDTN